MSTATAPERSHAPYAEPDEYIDYQLRKTQTGIKRIDMLTAAIVAITVLIGYVLLFVLSDHWLFEGGVGGTARMLMFLPVIGFVGWLIGAKVVWPALKTVSGLYAARTLEASSTEFRSSLLNLVDLKQAGREVSPLIMATIEKRAAVTLAKFNVDDAIDKRPLLRTLYVLFGIVVAFCAYSIFSPKKLGPSVLRAIVPFTNVTPATQTEILEVKPGDAKLRAGGILPVSVQLRGEVPSDVTLLFTTADRRFVDEPVQLGATTDPNLFEGTLGNDEHGLLQSFSYHVVAGDARSPEYRVEIITPPSATVTEVRYDYPEYTELDPRTQMGGAIDVWERTAITITAATNVPVKRGEFELADTEDFSAAYPGSSVRIADGRKLTITWRADPRQADGKFPKFYRIKVWDAEDTPDPKPAVYPINVRIDQPPQVVLIDPTTNLELPANGTVPLVVAARDQDFKLRTVSLKIARDENDVTDETLFDGSQQEVALKHDFQLEPLRLKAGDKIRIWVEAQDNRLPTHNLAKTPPIEITIKGKVTKEEAKKQLDEQKKEQQQRLDEAAKNNDPANDRSEQQPSDPASSPDQPPRDPNEPEQPKGKDDEANKEQPQQKGQQQDDKNSKGKDGGSGKTQKGGEGKKSETGSEGKSDKPGDKGNAADGKQSLKNDGTQDQEALEQVIKNEKRRGRLPKKSEPQTSPSSTQREPQENSNGESADKPMPNSSSKPNPQDDPKANDGSKTPPPNRGQQSKTDKNENADPKSPDGSKEPKGKSPKEGDEPKPGDNDSKKPDGDGKKPDPNDPKSINKSNGKEGDDKNADGGNKPMPKNNPGEKNDPSASEDKAGGEKPDSKPDAQKPAPTDKPGNDPKQSKPDGSGKSDSQKPKGLGKPETDDKQRSPDGAKSDKPSNDGKSQNPKEGDAGSDKPDPKKPNDPAGKGADDKDSKSPDKQPGSDKSEDSKPGDKGAEKADSSKKPQRGQQGDQSKESSNDKGGDKKSSSNKPGDDKPGQPKEGDKNDSGQSKKEGSQKSDKGGQKPGGKEGQQKSASKEGGGESSDSDSDSKGPAKPGSQGNKKGKAGSAPGGGSASQPGDPSSSNNPSGSGSSSGAPEEANEEFTKEAANLVLKRLQKDIERGEVDQELLDELGWTPEQMKKFVERMQQQLEAKPDDDSPQAKAKQRQFEEMLKNLNLTEKTQRRDDTNKDKQAGDGIGPVRRPPPPEYRESFESYTKSLSKKKAAETPKK